MHTGKTLSASCFLKDTQQIFGTAPGDASVKVNNTLLKLTRFLKALELAYLF